MSDDYTVYYWMGKPLSEIPRDELERLFVEAWKTIDDLNGLNIQARIERVRDLAASKRRTLTWLK